MQMIVKDRLKKGCLKACGTDSAETDATAFAETRCLKTGKPGFAQTPSFRSWQLLLPVAVGLMLVPNEAWASSGGAAAHVRCTATFEGNGIANSMQAIQFGNPENGISLLDNPNPSDVQANIRYTCTNSSNRAVNTRLCLHIDGGREYMTTYNPRKLPRYINEGNNNRGRNKEHLLDLMLLKPDGTEWGAQGASSPPPYETHVLSIAPNNSVSNNVSIRARISSANPGLLPAAQTLQNYYWGDFSAGSSIALAWKSEFSTVNPPTDCGLIQRGAPQTPFQVAVYIAPSCHIDSASDINFGTHTAGRNQLNAEGNISVRCTNGTPYSIGLIPSNGNQFGRGEMKSATRLSVNTDTVRYELRSGRGNAQLWGNNTGTPGPMKSNLNGNGNVQNYPVFATVGYTDIADTDRTPDEYQDRVTVHVKY